MANCMSFENVVHQSDHLVTRITKCKLVDNLTVYNSQVFQKHWQVNLDIGEIYPVDSKL